MNSIFLKISLCLILFSCNTADNKNVRNNYGQFPDPKSSVIIYLSNTNQVELTKCKAEKRNDSLFLKITDSSSAFLLNIIKVNETFSINMEQTFSITGSSDKNPTFTAIEKRVKLNKDSYEKGDELKGFLSLKVSVLHRKTELHTDTISVDGLVYATVQ